jgi:hypothetical protein
MLDDPNIVGLLTHYMGPNFVDWAEKNSPHNPKSNYANYLGTYDRIAQSIKPLAAARNPDIDLILKTLDRQIPIIGVPKWVRDKVEDQKGIDRLTGWTFRDKSPPVKKEIPPEWSQIAVDPKNPNAKFVVPDEK